MVAFRNRYFVMEVHIDPNRDLAGDDPIRLTIGNIEQCIKDSILKIFGECALASSLVSFKVKYVNPVTKLCVIRVAREDYQQIWSAITMIRSIGGCPAIFNLLNLSGRIKACKDAALKCDEAKFELYKLIVGDKLTPEVRKQAQNCFDKIKLLEH